MRFIGDRDRLDKKLQDLMAWIELRTAGNARLNLTVAINYGGRDELVRAAAPHGRKAWRAGEIARRRCRGDAERRLDTAGTARPRIW